MGIQTRYPAELEEIFNNATICALRGDVEGANFYLEKAMEYVQRRSGIDISRRVRVIKELADECYVGGRLGKARRCARDGDVESTNSYLEELMRYVQQRRSDIDISEEIDEIRRLASMNYYMNCVRACLFNARACALSRDVEGAEFYLQQAMRYVEEGGLGIDIIDIISKRVQEIRELIKIKGLGLCV